MKGLLLKDFYNMKDNMGATIVTAICFGLLFIVNGNPAMFVLAVALAGGSLASTCIKIDEMAKWGKYEITTPVSRKMIVVEKYLLLFLVTLAGLILGTIGSVLAGTLMHDLDVQKLLLYISVGFSLALVSGGLITLCIFKFGLIKSDTVITICYLIPVGLFVGALILLRYMGFDFMQGNIYFFLTCILPVLALIFTIIIAGINISVYKKHQF
ncbi:MAG: ABC-2 transporter permease [Clostridiales bacterium]|nr:ABC-2 transporter permease [Clostridiales bacterium]